jgi:uncharacterized OB-fold protein
LIAEDKIMPEEKEILLNTKRKPSSRYVKQYLRTWKCKRCGNVIYFEALRCVLCGAGMKEITEPRGMILETGGDS